MPRLTDMRTARAELQAELDGEQLPAPITADPRQLQERIAEALDAGPDHARKTIFRCLVHEIRVENR